MEKIKEWNYSKPDLSYAVSLIDNLKSNLNIEENLTKEIYVAATEIISNIIHHAYPIGFKNSENHECFISISIIDENTAQFSIADYGITIPKSIFDKISPDARRELISDNHVDSQLIEAAANGRHLPKQPWRGLGIASIVENTRQGIFDSLNIKSRHGSVVYSKRENRFLRDQDAIFQGTVIDISFKYTSRNIVRVPHIEMSVAKDFSAYPAGRFLADGPFSGEALSNKIREFLCKADVVTIDLDGTYGLASSFLEAAFGGLIRDGMTSSEIESRINIVSKQISYKNRIFKYIRTIENGNG